MTKIEELMNNEEFVEKVNNCTTAEDVENLKNEYDIQEEEEINEDELSKVAGGAWLGKKYRCKACGRKFFTYGAATYHMIFATGRSIYKSSPGCADTHSFEEI